MCVVGSDPVISCIAVLSCPEHGGVCVWSAAFYARTVRRRPPARSPSTNFRMSSTAMRCNSLSRRMVWCTYAMFKHTAAHAASGRCRTKQPRGVPGHPSPADPKLGLRLDHMDSQKMKMTGVSGLRTHDDRRRPRSPSVPPVRQTASDTVDLIHQCLPWAVIASCFAQAVEFLDTRFGHKIRLDARFTFISEMAISYIDFQI